MIKESDISLVRELLDDRSDLEIIHKHGWDRMVTDTKEVLDEVIDDYEEVKYDAENRQEIIREMERHIHKLEKMLENRNAKFKDWNDVVHDKNLDW